ncbi:hypothetical protein PVA38_11975 [Streptococcus pneumoniae D39]|nr:hypothetical protein PVA38_11975 [Streptococcus pneumoniae D39]
MTQSPMPASVARSTDKSFSTGTDSPVKAASSILRELASICLLYTSPSPRDRTRSRMPSSA